MPAGPSASKNASCGLTATAYGPTASMIPQQKRATSPRSSTGSRSGFGSSPTTSCDRLRSTSAASRSANVIVAATAIDGNVTAHAEGGPRAALRPCTRCRSRSALERSLQLAPGRELRHGRRGDLDALAGARVHALAGGALRGRELPEPGEVDGVAGLQRLGDGLHECVDGLAGVPRGEPRLRRDLVDEVLLGQRKSSYVGGWGSDLGRNPNNVGGRIGSTKRISGHLQQFR